MKNVVSLFANIGIGEAYLEKIGFKTIVANEIDHERCQIYKKIYPQTNMICGDISNSETQKNILEAISKREVELVIATPPCQGFSTLNSKRKDDQRNFLIYYAVELIKEMKPNYIIIENVKKFLSQIIEGKDVLTYLKDSLDNYFVESHILDAADYGTPQCRKRAVILCSKSGWVLPKKQEKITLKEAIGHLPSLESTERDKTRKWHFAQKHSLNHINWMKHTPTGKSAFENKKYFPQIVKNGKIRRIKGFGNSYKRMDWDQPANTLIAGCTMISSSNTVHPGRKNKDGTYSDARTFSILEAMIIMGLPEDWNLPEDISYRKAMYYIGEGVCPKLIKALVETIK